MISKSIHDVEKHAIRKFEFASQFTVFQVAICSVQVARKTSGEWKVVRAEIPISAPRLSNIQVPVRNFRCWIHHDSIDIVCNLQYFSSTMHHGSYSSLEISTAEWHITNSSNAFLLKLWQRPLRVEKFSIEWLKKLYRFLPDTISSHRSLWIVIVKSYCPTTSHLNLFGCSREN